MNASSANRAANVFMHGRRAGRLTEAPEGGFRFEYQADYDGPPVSLTMPVREGVYTFPGFPPFFDGLLPEGWQLEALLRSAKLDRQDFMGQLIAVGADTVGAVTITPAGDSDE
jgi:serine/threonine-protein kinase HipA